MTVHTVLLQAQTGQQPDHVRAADGRRPGHGAGRLLPGRGRLPLPAAQVPRLQRLLQQRAEPQVGKLQHTLPALPPRRLRIRW